ncbi:MAG: hypothetical protein ACTHLZ_18725 [Tepidisphaeraceae bacterium]
MIHLLGIGQLQLARLAFQGDLNLLVPIPKFVDFLLRFDDCVFELRREMFQVELERIHFVGELMRHMTDALFNKLRCELIDVVRQFRDVLFEIDFPAVAFGDEKEHHRDNGIPAEHDDDPDQQVGQRP